MMLGELGQKRLFCLGLKSSGQEERCKKSIHRNGGGEKKAESSCNRGGDGLLKCNATQAYDQSLRHMEKMTQKGKETEL